MPSELPPRSKELLARRDRLLGPNVSTFYDEPVHIVRGEGVWLWDADGHRYLDCYNNVPHVGHANPRVVEAICRQAATLNTHSRYLHEEMLDYIERLTATMDDSLSTAILTCTGSESNDIALRMAEAVTGARGIVATDGTYHGNTALVSQLSRSNVAQVGFGLSQYMRFVKAPESYRSGDDPAASARAFAEGVEQAIREHEKAGHGFAGLILDPFFVNEGFPALPEGWLVPAVEAVRRAGGIVIADEVQPGFGRIGSHFWGHQRQGFVPDVVTMGKPMGNGHPISAVIAGPDTMARFRKAFRYFNTFAGNPVSCAAAMAVLDEMEEKALQENARVVGEYALSRLEALKARHAVIGETRGSGLIFGAELVLDRATKEPAAAYTEKVVNGMRRAGVLLNKAGMNGATLKIRPPMPFSRENADLLVDTLDRVLTDTPLGQ